MLRSEIYVSSRLILEGRRRPWRTYDFLRESLSTRKKGPISFMFASRLDSFFYGGKIRSNIYVSSRLILGGRRRLLRTHDFPRERSTTRNRAWFPLRIHRSQIFFECVRKIERHMDPVASKKKWHLDALGLKKIEWHVKNWVFKQLRWHMDA